MRTFIGHQKPPAGPTRSRWPASITDAIERVLAKLGRQVSADVVTAANALAGGFWQATHPPPQLVEAYAEGPVPPPEWTIDFQPILTRILTATCVWLI